jgi:hypothetical protein
MKKRKELEYNVVPTPLKPNKIVKFAIKTHCPDDTANKSIEGYRRSKTTKEALITDFLRCDLPEPPLIEDEHLMKGIEMAKKLLGPPKKYRPVHYNDTKQYPWTKSTSVEAPFTKDTAKVPEVLESLHKDGKIPNTRRTFGNLFDYVYEYNRPIVHHIKEEGPKGDRYFYHNTAHARSHLVTEDEDDKVRMVHGVPKLLLQVECMFLYPYFNYLRKQESSLLWGYETLMGGIYRLYHDISRSQQHYNTFIGVDWSQFDKRVSFKLINIVHDIWEEYIDFEHGYMPSINNPSSSTDPQRLKNLYKWMRNAVRYTPVLVPDGSLYKRRHCTLASGLLQTQLLDSWINAIVILTVLSSLGFDISSSLLKVLGDDSIIGTHMVGSYSKEQILDLIDEESARRFGFKMSRKPTTMILPSMEGMQVLGYSCDNGLPYRDETKLLAQLLYPERYPSLSQLRARAVGIVIASCGRSDLVYNVCKDVFNYCSRTTNVSDPSGSHFRSYIRELFDIDFDDFPDKQFLKSRMFNLDLKSDMNNDKFWKRDFFLDEF